MSYNLQIFMPALYPRWIRHTPRVGNGESPKVALFSKHSRTVPAYKPLGLSARCMSTFLKRRTRKRIAPLLGYPRFLTYAQAEICHRWRQLIMTDQSMSPLWLHENARAYKICADMQREKVPA